MSKEVQKESKSHGHGIHLHLPSRKQARSLSVGRVSPISFLSGNRKSNNDHSRSNSGNGNSGNGNGGNADTASDGNGVRAGAVLRSTTGNGELEGRGGRGAAGYLSNPPSSHTSPSTSPMQQKKNSVVSLQPNQVSMVTLKYAWTLPLNY